MKHWERLEEYIYELDIKGIHSFTQKDVKDYFGVSGTLASRYITAHQNAQRRDPAPTLYTLHRADGRTSAAVWYFGDEIEDVEATARQYLSDIKVKSARDPKPIIRRIGQKNPQLLPQAQAIMSMIEVCVKMLETML